MLFKSVLSVYSPPTNSTAGERGRSWDSDDAEDSEGCVKCGAAGGGKKTVPSAGGRVMVSVGDGSACGESSSSKGGATTSGATT